MNAQVPAAAVRAVRSFSEIPGPSPSIPLIGNSWQYFKIVGRYDLKKMHEASLDKFNRYGPIVREEYEWKKPVIHLFDPCDFEKIFRSKEKCPMRPESEFLRHYRQQNPDRYPTIGIGHSQGEEWYEERQRIAPILLSKSGSAAVPENHIPKQNDICNDFITYLYHHKDIDHVIPDVREATNRMALESICSLCLGNRMGVLSIDSPAQSSSSSSSGGSVSSLGSHLISLTSKLFNSYNKLYYGLPTWKFYPSASYREFCEVEEDIYNLTMRFIDKHSCEDEGKGRDSVIGALMQGQSCDARHIPIIVSDLITGGTFTIANSLTYLIHNLACNPDVQQMVYQELRSVGVNLKKESRIGFDELTRIPYLKAVLKESFRLTSPIPAIVRVLGSDAVLSGYHVPRGTKVFSHFLVTCQMEKYFPDPSSFKPERWLGRNRQHVNPFASMPFGTGPRMCVGRRFAEHQLHMSLAKLVLNFHMEPIDGELLRTHEFIVVPSQAVPIRFIPRS